jgi:hypothetical protein
MSEVTAQMLPSWNDGPAKATIVGFVESTTRQGADFIPPNDRIATFDNDGTLWAEQPMPPQVDFLFQTWTREVTADPSLASQQPYKALIERDPGFFQGLATQDAAVVASIEAAAARSWHGTTPDEFDAQVRDWFAIAKHPTLQVAYTELVYQPMLELFELLTAHEFRVFVCSAAGETSCG